MMVTLRSAFFFFPFGLALIQCNPSSSDTDGGGGTDGGPVNTCKPAAGAGTMHNASITADETWSAASSPHIVTFDISVKKGATLTIEPCAVVRVQAAHAIVVEGNLVAEGVAGSPIQFVADDASKPWGFIQVFAPGKVSLAYASIDDAGGEPVNAWGALEARGDQLMPAQEILKVDHVTVNRSSNYGVSLRAGGAFTKDSHDLVVTGSKVAPLRILPRLASNVPTGTYTGNAKDAIVIETEAYGEVNYEDVTVHDRGVPYQVGADKTFGDFKVGPNHFTLTLEAGVTMKFKKGSALLGAVDSGSSTGVIVASGTAAKPVVLTSAEAAPAAGDWVGVQFGKVADAGFKLDHVEIRYAGGASQSSGHHCQPNPTTNGQQSKNDDAALAIYHQPAGELLTNSLISDSAGDGVDLAYTGTFVDHKPTNTFTAVASCPVTLPLPTQGLCPNMGCP